MDALYTAVATATNGGRDGRAVVSDGSLDLQLATPKELGGSGKGNNPEQLFAAGYSACFASALGLTGRQAGVDLSHATVTLAVSAIEGALVISRAERTVDPLLAVRDELRLLLA